MREGSGSGSEEATAAGEEEEIGRAPSGRGQRPAAAVRGGAGRDGGGDGARGLHLRSWGAAPGGCNGSRDDYNSATPRGEEGCCGIGRSGGSRELLLLPRRTCAPGFSPVLLLFSGEVSGGGALGVARCAGFGLVWEGAQEAGWH